MLEAQGCPSYHTCVSVVPLITDTSNKQKEMFVELQNVLAKLVRLSGILVEGSSESNGRPVSRHKRLRLVREVPNVTDVVIDLARGHWDVRIVT